MMLIKDLNYIEIVEDDALELEGGSHKKHGGHKKHRRKHHKKHSHKHGHKKCGGHYWHKGHDKHAHEYKYVWKNGKKFYYKPC